MLRPYRRRDRGTAPSPRRHPRSRIKNLRPPERASGVGNWTPAALRRVASRPDLLGMIRPLLLSLTAACALTLPIAAQTTSLTGFSFLRLDPSARAAALGGAYGPVGGDDVNGFFYNPAQLDEALHRGLSLSYLNHLADINAGVLSYAHTTRYGTVGGGLRYLDYGSFETADENGVRDGTTFGASDVALTVGLARGYGERLRYGANVHAVFSSIAEYSAQALAFDAGVLFLVPGRQLSLSASVHNAGTVLSPLGDTDDELPLDVRVGVGKQLRYLPLLLSFTGYDLNRFGEDEDRAFGSELLHHLAFGGEFRFGSAFQLRIGYNHRRHEELKTNSRLDLAGFGLGFGLKVTRIRFDYAYNSWSSLGGLHQLTLRTVL